jgi:hypothetical protein
MNYTAFDNESGTGTNEGEREGAKAQRKPRSIQTFSY